MANEINNIIIALDDNSDSSPNSNTRIPNTISLGHHTDDTSTDDDIVSQDQHQATGYNSIPMTPDSTDASAPTDNGSPTHNLPVKKRVSFLSEDVDEDKSPRSPRREEPLDKASALIAATLVADAKEGRNLPFIMGEKHVNSYLTYHNMWLRWALYACIVFIHLLALFEEPAVDNLGLPYWATMIMEAVCLGYFVFRILHAMSFQHANIFFKDAKNILVILVIMLTILDMVCYIIWDNLATSGHPIRWSRFLRPLFIVNFPAGKQIRRAFRNIRRTVPDILNVLVLFLLSVLLFGLLALKLFSRRNLKYPNGDAYFGNYFDSVWDLYVLVTTANNPDVMMPAYNHNNGFVIFFIIYLILCLYIFMSIVLAAIYNNYRKNLKNEIKSAVFLKRQQLSKAFELLKVKRGENYVITHARWKELTSILLPGKSEVYCDLMMTILDDDNTGVLSKKNFMNMADLLHVQLSEVKDRLTLQEKLFPSIYNHRYSEIFKMAVRHRFFRYAFDLMIAINALFIAIDLDVADWFFLSIFTVEILCNLYVAGVKEYFRRFWYTFDFLVIGAALFATIIEKAMGTSDSEVQTLDVLLVLRVMRLIKLFGSINRFKIILQTLLNIGSSIVMYGGVFFVFYYFFAIIGMELFSGLIRSDIDFCGNSKLNGTMFLKYNYCGNNFNDILKALVVIFELTVVNQWHVLTSGFVAVTNKAARLYFFTFHMCTVVIVLNIFTAFILEAFILEYTLQTVPKLESVVEGKIKELGLGIGMVPRKMSIQGPSGDKIDLVNGEVPPAESETEVHQPTITNGDEDDVDELDVLPDLKKEKGFKFHLRKRSRKKVEVLLQQMFQGELGDFEDGPEDLDDIDNYRRTRKLTFDEVA